MIPTTLTVPITYGGHGLSLMLLGSLMVLSLSAITMIVSKLYRRWF